MATADADRCAQVDVHDAGSRWTRAATASPIPAIVSAIRARSRLSASPKQVSATTAIATSTSHAAGAPGTARRLTVAVTGSYPGVRKPATVAASAATGGPAAHRRTISGSSGRSAPTPQALSTA